MIAAALGDEDLREVVLLAAGLSDDIADSVIRAATELPDTLLRSRALLWAADAVTDGAAARGRSVAALLASLADVARRAMQRLDFRESGQKDGHSSGSASLGPADRSSPGWKYAQLIAKLLVPSGLRRAIFSPTAAVPRRPARPG